MLSKREFNYIIPSAGECSFESKGTGNYIFIGMPIIVPLSLDLSLLLAPLGCSGFQISW